MLLVQAFAVIGVFAQAHLVAQAQRGFQGPIGIGQALAGGAHDVAVAALEHGLGHVKVVHPTGAHHWGGLARCADGAADARRGSDVAAKRPLLVGQILGHAFIAAAPGVGIGAGPHAGLLGIIKLATARGGDEVHARTRKLLAKPHRIVQGVAPVNAFLGQIAATHHILGANGLAHRGIDLQRQANALLARSAIAVGAHIGGG